MGFVRAAGNRAGRRGLSPRAGARPGRCGSVVAACAAPGQRRERLSALVP
ncbi:hypothetical protein [Lysobacter gummosus]